MGKREWKIGRLLAMGFILPLLSCGSADEAAVAETAVPQDYCALPESAPVEQQRVEAVGLRPAEHGGSASDLNLGWTADTVTRRLCPGQHTIDLAIRNDSGHTVGRNVWFTILYYQGNEYVRAHRISSQGINVAVGETVPVQFSVDIKPEFASAGNRNIRIAVIVQTDNPNPSDPLAYFRRVWVDILPAGGCAQEALPQPARDPIMIYAVTCEGRNVRLQTAPRLIQGSPSARVVDGQQYMTLTRDAYFENDLWWADLYVTQNIPLGEQSMVSFGSNANDTLYFVFGPRVECGGDGSAFMTSPQGRRDTDGGLPEPGDPGDGSSPDDPGDGSLPDDPGTDPGDGDPISDPDPEDLPGIDEDVPDDLEFEGTAWFELDPCGAPLEGTRVSPDMAAASGRVALGEPSATEIDLTLRTTGLPVSAENRIYQAWMAVQVGESLWHFVPMATFQVEDSEGATLVTSTVNPLSVRGLGESPGREVLIGPGGPVGSGLGETGGIAEALPLDVFTHFFVTVEDAPDAGEVPTVPSPRMALSATAPFPEAAAPPQ